MFLKSKKIGLALGGGGVRGLAHIGVLKLLEELEIEPYCIAGSSMGAIVGGGYSLYKDSHKLEQKIFDIIKECRLEKLEHFNSKSISFRNKEGIREKLLNLVKEMYIWTSQTRKKSLLSSEWLDKSIRLLVDGYNFEDLKILFSSVTVDLIKGEEVVFNREELNIALKSSCSIPGIFPPVEWEGKQLVDGGIISMVPVRVCKDMHPDKVIAVNVERGNKVRNLQCGWDIILQADDIKGAYLKREELCKADLILDVKLPDITWSEFSKAKTCINEGYKVANSYKDKIRTLSSKFSF